MAIYVDEKNNAFYLEGKNVSYIIDVHEGYLRHLYFGEKLIRDDFSALLFNHRAGYIVNITDSIDGCGSLEILSQEYSSFGLGDYRQPSIKVVANGSRVTDLKFCKYYLHKTEQYDINLPHIKDGEILEVILQDKTLNIQVSLFYKIFDDENVIVRWAKVNNLSNETIKLDRVMSACLDFDDKDFDIISLHGKHSCECQSQRNSLNYATYEISSSKGMSSHQHNPFVALCDKSTNENCGAIFGFNLVYSGSFIFQVEKSCFGSVRLVGGINPIDFEWTLEKNETFVTPQLVCAYSSNGINGMSHAFHDVYRNHLINNNFAFEARPVVINNWEATYFDFDTKKLFEIIDKAKDTGIDTFVLDDGWFGNRNNDKSSLGDWTVNTNKLLGGLNPIIEKCHDNGLKFGIWIEPEMISPDSNLFALHPDWAISCPNRKAVLSRNQYVLDMTRKDVVDYLKNTFYNLLASHAIDYVKWDTNRSLTENYSFRLPIERQKEFQHRYILGVYELANHLTSSFPKILFEGCAGGGGRFDAAMLYYFPQIWASDATDANERINIQYGASLCYPLSSISNHISCVPNHQSYRTIEMFVREFVSYLGISGYELDITSFTRQQLNEIKLSITKYKEIQKIILIGDYYRNDNPFESNYFSSLVINKEKTSGFIFWYQRLTSYGIGLKFLRINGLDDNKIYNIKELKATASGKTLKNMGVQLTPKYCDFSGYCFEINEIIK